MATDKPRFSVTFTDDSFSKIQKYQKENNISTQSKAVARLVELAISEIESEDSKKNPPSTAEAAPGEDTLKMLEDLNTFLVGIGYIGEDDDLTDQQLDVLLGICPILRATFEQEE